MAVEKVSSPTPQLTHPPVAPGRGRQASEPPSEGEPELGEEGDAVPVDCAATSAGSASSVNGPRSAVADGVRVSACATPDQLATAGDEKHDCGDPDADEADRSKRS
jgi:hypothetical protein